MAGWLVERSLRFTDDQDLQLGELEGKRTGAGRMKKTSSLAGLLQSGLIFSFVNFLTGLGNLAFQAVVVKHLPGDGQYGDANSAISGFLPLLSLASLVATFAITHYIAHFHTMKDHDRLQGLILGCRKFLFRLTVVGSILVVIVIKPLSNFFNYNQNVMLVTMLCALLGLWSAYVTALCQGLSWFKRLALIGFLSMVLRMAFGIGVTLHWPTAETMVLATAFSLLANLIILFWRKDLKLPGKPVSPWGREFVHYLVVSAACVVGSYCFMQGDYLIAKKFLPNGDNDAYNVARQLAGALPTTVAPLLTVFFTSRSGSRGGSALAEQMKLIGIYVVGLLTGAGLLYLLREFCVWVIWRKRSPEAEMMIGQLALPMVFIGLLQAVAYWALASRWSRITLLYGALGGLYWLVLFLRGRSVETLLPTMCLATGTALVILFLAWFITMRRHRPVPQT